jgi:hypothetical protein
MIDHGIAWEYSPKNLLISHELIECAVEEDIVQCPLLIFVDFATE